MDLQTGKFLPDWWRRAAAGFAVVDEVRRARLIEQRVADRRRDCAVPAERRYLIQEVARMAGTQRPARRQIVPAMQRGDQLLMKRETPPPALESDLRSLQGQLRSRGTAP